MAAAGGSPDSSRPPCARCRGALVACLAGAAVLLTAHAPEGQARPRPKAPARGDVAAASDESENFWDRTLHPHRPRARALVREATALLDTGRAGAARPLLEEAVRLEPGEADGHFWLGRAYLAERRWADCARELQAVFRIAPAYASRGGADGPLGDLGLCLALSGRLDESAAAYQRAIAAGSAGGGAGRHVLHYNLGDTLQALGRLEEAILEYRRAIELVPHESLAHFALAVAYDRDGQVGRATESMREALRLDPSPDLTDLGRVVWIPAEEEDYYRGFAHQVAGRRALAVVHFRRFVDRGGANPWLRQARDHLVQLGPATLQAEDVQFWGQGTIDRRAVTRAVVAAAPRLVECLAGEQLGRVVVKVTIHPSGRAEGRRPTSGRTPPPAASARPGAGGSPPPPQSPTGAAPSARSPAAPAPGTGGPGSPGVWVASDGPVQVTQEVVTCVAQRARELSLPAPVGSPVGIGFSVVVP